MRLIDGDALYAKAAKLEEEAMEDLLKCDFNKDHETWLKLNKVLIERTAFKFDIADAPTVEDRKTGKWHQRIYSKVEMMVCSECNSEFSYDAETGARDYNYCPYCGAKMMAINEEEKEI